MRIAPLALAIVLGTLPAQVAGQSPSAGQRCQIQSASSSTRGTTFRDEGRTFMGGGVFFECEGGTTIRSDSLAHYQTAGMVEFYGAVLYADTVKTLSAEYVRYISRIGQVIAQDSVILTDIETGSQIRAPYLEYFQATEIRPEALVRIPSGRPRAILVSQPGDSSRRQGDLAHAAQDSSSRPAVAGRDGLDRRDSRLANAETPDSMADAVTAVPSDSTLIDADAMDFYGQRLAVARGNVVVLREDMQAFGREAHFDQSADSILMTGAARVVTDDRQVHGDTIAALVTPERELRQVNAWRNARLESDDLEAEAPGLRILFKDGEVHRMIALGDRTGSRGGKPRSSEGAPQDEAAQPEATAFAEDPTVQPAEPTVQPERTRPPDEAAESEAAESETAESEVPVRREPAAEQTPVPEGRLADAVPPAALAAEGLAAAGAAEGEGARAGEQARITSKDVRMVGDSIDARAPGQQIERVTAVGAAFGERLTTDTTVLRPAIAKNDWMSGDTLIATFAAAPDSAAADTTAAETAGMAGETVVAVATEADSAAAADSAADRPERVLETLTAIADSAKDARSLYAVANEEDPEAPPALNYLIAQRIQVTLRDGAVLDVNAVGRDGKPVHGLYLEAADSSRTRAEPTDSTGTRAEPADSSGTRAEPAEDAGTRGEPADSARAQPAARKKRDP